MTINDDATAFEHPARRRWFLLWKALESMPLERAIDLARAAEVFVMGVPVESQSEHASTEGGDPVKSVSDEPVRAAMPSAETAISHGSHSVESTEVAARLLDPPAPNSVVGSEPTPARRSNLALSAEQREHLLQRLAMGAKNAELAHEFRLTMQQVQGVRMGCGREIAARRERLSHPKQLSEGPKHVSEQTLNTSICTADDVIRYLRQQDDVVVPQGNGEFVINGRFRLPFSEVITRANKMRRRQGKPDFDVAGSPLAPAALRAANGHPLFWAERKAAANGANLPES